MKKFFLFLMGAVFSVTMAAGVTDLSFTATKSIAAGGEIWWTTAANVAAGNTAGWCATNTYSNNSKYGNIIPKLSGDEVGDAASYKLDGVLAKATNTPADLTTNKKALVFKVTNTTEFTVYGATTGGSQATSVWLSVYKADGTAVDVDKVGVGAGPNMTCTATVTGLNASDTYVVNIIGGLKATAGQTPATSAGGQDMVVYAIKFAAPASGKTASSFTLTSANELVIVPNGTSQITTTGNAGTITYTSGETSVATVSNTGLITGVAGGITAITVSDPGSATVDGKDITVAVKTLYAEDKSSSLFKFDNNGYFLTNNGNWYFKNGWSITTDQTFQYAALNCNGLTNNGFKATANKTYTINVPAGVTIRSAKVTMRSNYGNDKPVANWGTIFGQDLSAEALPFNNEEAETKEFAITNETPMTITPAGNQCQMYIELSTEAIDPNKPVTFFSMKVAATSNISISDGADHVNLPAGANLTINGGSVTVSNGQSDSKNLVTSAGFSLTNGNTFFTVTLDEALRAGDVITATMSQASRGLKFSTNDAYSTDYPGEAASTIDFSYTVLAEDGICGETTFNIFRATGNTTTFNKFQIARPVPTTITLNASGYATYSSQKALMVTAGATAYKASVSGSTITCTAIANNLIPAGTGVLLYGEPNAEVALVSVATAPAVEGNNLHATTLADGTLANKPAEGYIYALSGNQFLQYDGAAFVANKAYFHLNTAPAAEAPMTIIFADEEGDGIVTAVDHMPAQLDPTAPVFNMLGQQVSADTKGILIQNGKKFIVK